MALLNRPVGLVPDSSSIVKAASKAEIPLSSITSLPWHASKLQLASCHVESICRAPAVISSFATEGRVLGVGRSTSGAGLLERPGLDQSNPDTGPRTEEGGEMGKSQQRVRFGSGDRYRVLLLDHERHTESQVAKVIPRVVPDVTPEEARKCFFESRELGVALVTIAVKEHAEFYVQMLTRYGLRSTMEENGTIS